MSWLKSVNLTKSEGGTIRSIAGYAGESLVVGRALLCGFNLFFKAWRDSKYDAVLDSKGVLYRIEIKQTLGDTTLSVSSGGRSGEQISRESESREKPLSTDDCDYVIGTTSANSYCWIVPTELIEILEIKSLSLNQIELFKEKWAVFLCEDSTLRHHLRDGFRKLEEVEIRKIATYLNVPSEFSEPFRLDPTNNRTKKFDLSIKDRLVVEIWMAIFRGIPDATL